MTEYNRPLGENPGSIDYRPSLVDGQHRVATMIAKETAAHNFDPFSYGELPVRDADSLRQSVIPWWNLSARWRRWRMVRGGASGR